MQVGTLIFAEEDGELSACSGALIAPSVVLTAAHCFFDIIAKVSSHTGHCITRSIVHGFMVTSLASIQLLFPIYVQW